jgi:cysteine desulfurase
VAHLTENFTFEGPLSPRVRESIAAAFEQGWADPKKLSQASHRAQGLRNSAIEEFAQVLGISPACIEVVSEPNLLHHLALNGFLTPDSHIYTSSVDVGKIRAVARAHSGKSSQLELADGGVIVPPSSFNPDDVVSVQATNGETGISQDLNLWRQLGARVVLDGTRAIPVKGLTDGFVAATFDSQSWDGPQGLGLLVINKPESFRYPLAHIAPIRVPGSYSLPLLVGSVIALNEYRERHVQICSIRNSLAQLLDAVPDVTVIGSDALETRYLSFIVNDISAEEVLRSLLKSGISIDAGSACTPEDLAPSHVIAAMGYPTSGHLRATIHQGVTQNDVENLSNKLREVLQNLSR